MVKDPDTGKRVSRANPPEEWKREKVPALAIVEQSLFEAVQARKRDRSHEAPQRQREARATCCQACSNEAGDLVDDPSHAAATFIGRLWVSFADPITFA